jgi:hypothetical protein
MLVFTLCARAPIPKLLANFLFFTVLFPAVLDVKNSLCFVRNPVNPGARLNI